MHTAPRRSSTFNPISDVLDILCQPMGRLCGLVAGVVLDHSCQLWSCRQLVVDIWRLGHSLDLVAAGCFSINTSKPDDSNSDSLGFVLRAFPIN